MKIPACTKCDRTGFIITSSGDRGYCDCPAGDLSRALGRPEPEPKRAEDTVRVLRILEYTGPRSVVEKTVSRSITGEVTHGSLTIRAATIGQYPEILTSDGGLKPEPELMPICGDPDRDDEAF